MTDKSHGRVYTCQCGESFDSEQELENHVEAEMYRKFNIRVGEWVAENLGDPFFGYYESLGPNGLRGVSTAHRNDIEIELTDKQVRKAALQWSRDALLEGNATEMIGDLQ